MSLIDNIKDDIKAVRHIRLPGWALLTIAAGSVPLYWLFDRFGKLATTLPILNSVAVIALVITLKRDLATHRWFWVTMMILAGLHVPLLLFVPWGTKWIPALAFAAADSLDIYLMLWILAVVKTFMEAPTRPTG